MLTCWLITDVAYHQYKTVTRCYISLLGVESMVNYCEKITIAPKQKPDQILITTVTGFSRAVSAHCCSGPPRSICINYQPRSHRAVVTGKVVPYHQKPFSSVTQNIIFCDFFFWQKCDGHCVRAIRKLGDGGPNLNISFVIVKVGVAKLFQSLIHGLSSQLRALKIPSKPKKSSV